MPKKQTGVTKRKNGTWMAQAELGRDPATGKRNRITRYGKTPAEAKAKLDEAKAAIKDGTYIEDESLTLGQWLDHWLRNYVDNNVKHSTFVEYKRFVEKRYIPHPLCVSFLPFHLVTGQQMWYTVLHGTRETAFPHYDQADWVVAGGECCADVHRLVLSQMGHPALYPSACHQFFHSPGVKISPHLS